MTSPGPWRWDEIYNLLANGEPLGICFEPGVDGLTPEHRANLTLISKAPEMAAMLRMLEWVGGDNAAEPCCPVCGGYAEGAIYHDETKGIHKPNCGLAKFLSELP